MDWNITSGVIGLVIGAPIWGAIGYFVKRRVEKHPRSESLGRDRLYLEVMEKFLDVHTKAKSVKMTVDMPLETIDARRFLEANQPVNDNSKDDLIADRKKLLHQLRWCSRQYLFLTVMSVIATDDSRSEDDRRWYAAFLKTNFLESFPVANRIFANHGPDDTEYSKWQPMYEQMKNYHDAVSSIDKIKLELQSLRVSIQGQAAD